MFDINKVYSMYNGSRFLCDCTFRSEKEAKYFEASYLGLVREVMFVADLYHRNNVVILDTPNRNATIKIAMMLNNSKGIQ